MSAARRIWLKIHLYFGLLLGGLFALIGLTGSALVFYVEIDSLLNPGIQASRSDAPIRDYGAILGALRAAYPERDGAWRIELPMQEDTPVMARYYTPSEKAGADFAPLIVTVDPRTLALTSERFWGEFAMTWLYDLHYSLLMGFDGRTFVGIVGLAMLVSLVSGVYLWWPRGRGFVAALRPRLRHGTARRTFDLHVLSGVYGVLFLGLLALTGAALALPDTVRSLIEPISPLARTPELQVTQAPGAQRLSVDKAVEIARARFPDAEPRWIDTPGEAGGSYRIRLRQAFEPSRRFPRSHVWIDPYSGDILAVRDPATDGAGDTLLNWLHPLHNGEAFGLTGRIVVLVAGFLPAILTVSGLVRWRQKRRAVVVSRARESAQRRAA